ncbi:hypothetical protein B0H65DRAFT_477900 [Neurospora tetraspora]|uniref:Uncharacterized protein n=1 Tax=Neurospora tetraspora TaxID=94610 RepID=A0AAE0J7S9_9PEZI|nr:hypothetical protein B0H65DRAFT_477900 [Neurospora tetraspora]
MTEITQPESSTSKSVEPGPASKGSSSRGGNLIDGPSTLITETTPLLALSHQAEISAPQQPQPQVPAAGSSILRHNIKIFFLLGLKPKCSTFSHFPTLLLHCSFALSLYRAAACDYGRCTHLTWWIFDFIWAFIVVELWIFFQRAVLTTFHEYHSLLQQEREGDGTEENEAQLCHVCGPTRPQGSRLSGLTTSSEALAFLRVLIAMELVLSMRYREFLLPTLAWLGYTCGSFNHAKGGPMTPRTSHAGPLERHMWRVIEISILNWQAWLIMLRREGLGWDWLWSCVAVHATTGLVWELRDHEGVNDGRRDDLETGGSGAVEADAAVPSPVFGSRPRDEVRSESPGQHQGPVTEDIDTAGHQQPADDSTMTRTVFSVYGERGPRWFSALWILWWALNIDTFGYSLDHYPSDVTIVMLFGLGLVLAVLLIWTRSRAWNRRVAMLWVMWYIIWLTIPAVPRFYLFMSSSSLLVFWLELWEGAERGQPWRRWRKERQGEIILDEMKAIGPLHSVNAT